MEKKPKTKDRILEKALELFNAEGVERVTTSYIAKELGISLGNLHYHFPNRNELIKALIDRFLAEVGLLIVEYVEKEKTGFMEYVFRMQFLTYHQIWRYRFLFNDRLVIKRRTSYLETRFEEMIAVRSIEFKAGMEELRRNGLLRADISEEVLDAYFRQIVITNNSWVSYTELFPHEGDTSVYFSEQAILNWKPFLNCTDEEMRSAIDRAKDSFRTFISES